MNCPNCDAKANCIRIKSRVVEEIGFLVDCLCNYCGNEWEERR